MKMDERQTNSLGCLYGLGGRKDPHEYFDRRALMFEGGALQSFCAVGEKSQSKVPLSAKPPLDPAAIFRHAGDMAPKLLLQRQRPGDELKSQAVIDHGEPAGRESEALTVDAGDSLAGCRWGVGQSRVSRDHRAGRIQFTLP